MNTTVIDQVITGYVTALLWSSAHCAVDDCAPGLSGDECTHQLDAHTTFGVGDLTAEDLATVRAEVSAFVDAVGKDFEDYLAQRRYDPSDGSAAEHFGHDFALTRNHHGAGFWDRGLGDLGDRLTTLAHSSYSEVNVYVSRTGIELT